MGFHRSWPPLRLWGRLSQRNFVLVAPAGTRAVNSRGEWAMKRLLTICRPGGALCLGLAHGGRFRLRASTCNRSTALSAQAGVGPRQIGTQLRKFSYEKGRGDVCGRGCLTFVQAGQGPPSRQNFLNYQKGPPTRSLLIVAQEISARSERTKSARHGEESYAREFTEQELNGTCNPFTNRPLGSPETRFDFRPRVAQGPFFNSGISDF